LTAGGRSWLLAGIRAVARSLVLAILFPCAAFVVIGSAAPEFQLDRYRLDEAEGYVPRTLAPGGGRDPSVAALTGFYLQFFSCGCRGHFGRSRDAADRPLSALLAQRALPSAGVLAVALAVTIVATWAGFRLSGRVRRSGWRRALHSLPVALGWMTEGLPLPFTGMVAFVLVVRLAPRDGILESAGAMVIWAGLALALGDAVSAGVVRAVRAEAGRVRRRPHVLAARLRGETEGAALWPVLLPVAAARLRSATLLFLGGLVVVEPALGINGIGETLRDLVVDRAGIDALLLAGVLQLFAIPVALLDLAASMGRFLRPGVTGE
jgi:ABC-type dipeptide/oligopeptide/nickel transport system permease component